MIWKNPSIRDPARPDTDEPTDALQDQINKRLTLNLLIQGSAQHAFLTSHYIVRDDLNAIDPDLLLLYDQLALAGFVQYWRDEFVVIHGWPDRFWKRTGRPKHPFHRFPLLAKHGLTLATASKKRAYERCRAKKVTRIPLLISMQFLWRILRTLHKESKHKPALVELAKDAAQQAWGIPARSWTAS